MDSCRITMIVDHIPPIDISVAELNALLRNTDKPVLAYIWAPWCQPCKTMTPEIARAAGELANRVVVVKLNAVTETQALTPFNLAAVPVLILFSTAGQERARNMKTLPAQQIVKWVRDGGRKSDG